MQFNHCVQHEELLMKTLNKQTLCSPDYLLYEDFALRHRPQENVAFRRPRSGGVLVGVGQVKRHREVVIESGYLGLGVVNGRLDDDGNGHFDLHTYEVI